MSTRLDAHAHFFDPGFVNELPEDCRRRSPTEITLYAALAQQHEIEQVLAVGYEGDAWAAGNNAYLAGVTAQYPWVRPVAFVNNLTTLTVAQLVAWQAQNFVGLSLYLFSDEALAALDQVATEVWDWLADHAWLISVNSTGDYWTKWQPILTDHPELRLLIAHLGLPPAATTELDLEAAHTTLSTVLDLAQFPNVHVKFSGFYALAQPRYAYPHAAAMPYAEAISATYGTARIIWASDFSPALEHVSFPQTIAVLEAMPWLTEADRTAIYHDNLARLLASVEERKDQT